VKGDVLNEELEGGAMRKEVALIYVILNLN